MFSSSDFDLSCTDLKAEVFNTEASSKFLINLWHFASFAHKTAQSCWKETLQLQE